MLRREGKQIRGGIKYGCGGCHDIKQLIGDGRGYGVSVQQSFCFYFSPCCVLACDLCLLF